MNKEILESLLPFSGREIKIIKSDILPKDTIIVGPELYELLKTIPLEDKK